TSRRGHTMWVSDWSADVCSSDLVLTFTVLLVPVAAQQTLRAPAGKAAAKPPTAPAPDCTLAEHPHHFYDMRLAHVEIVESDACRSEERRVGKEWRSRWAPYDQKN